MAGHVLTRPGLRPDSVAGYLAAISVAHQTVPVQKLATATMATTAAATATAAETPPVATDPDASWPRVGGGHGQLGAATGLVDLDALATTADAAGESWANPARHEAVLRVLAGIGRQPTVRPTRRRHALSPTGLEAIVARLDRPSTLPTHGTPRCC